jgi:hypothetical protein
MESFEITSRKNVLNLFLSILLALQFFSCSKPTPVAKVLVAIEIQSKTFRIVHNGHEILPVDQMKEFFTNDNTDYVVVRCALGTFISDLRAPLELLASNGVTDYVIEDETGCHFQCFFPTSSIGMNDKMRRPYTTYNINELLEGKLAHALPPYSRVKFPDQDISIAELIRCLLVIRDSKCIIIEHRELTIFMGNQKDWE